MATTVPVPRLRTHLCRVTRVADLGAGMRRITVGGGDLTGYEPLPNPDQFLYLLAPPPGQDELAVDADTFSWEAYYLLDEAVRPVGAYYTVRHHRPEAAEIDLDVVLHGGTGPASRWAMGARPGTPVALWGPRTTFTPPGFPDDADVDRYLLVADETGLPAVEVILGWLPAGIGADVVAEVDGPAGHRPLTDRPDVAVHWVHRHGAAPGTTTALVDGVRALPAPTGRPYVWGGAESRAMTAVRRHLRHEVGLPRERVSLTPYWRHAAHAADADDEDEG